MTVFAGSVMSLIGIVSIGMALSCLWHREEHFAALWVAWATIWGLYGTTGL